MSTNTEAQPDGSPVAIVPDDLPAGPHRALAMWWQAIADSGRLPGRGDFDPREMSRAVPFVTLFDVERDPLRFRVRLVGTAIVEVTGVDMTSRYLDEREEFAQAIDRCRRLVETNQPYFHTGLPLLWSPNNFKTYSVLGLPLATDGRTVDMVLGTLTFA